MIQVTITDKQYKPFIEYASATCTSFSLVFNEDDIDKSKYTFQDIYLSMEDFILSTKKIGYHPDTGTYFENSDINFFKCNRFTKAVLIAENNVFNWNGIFLPEELCFYRKDKKWFCCVCHERYLFIYDETKEDISFFNKQGIMYYF